MKTAMEQLIELLKNTRDFHQNAFSYSEFNFCVIHAEKMLETEKQQIIDAANDVLAQNDISYTTIPVNLGEQYFNENYK